MIEDRLLNMNRKQIKQYIVELQNIVKINLKKGHSIDYFLDETKIFDDIERILPDEEFGVFVLTILNGFDSKIIYDTLVDSIAMSINEVKKNGIS